MGVILELRAVERLFEQRSSALGRIRTVVRAVDGIDLAIRDGETVGICGESGSGKTTLAYLVVGLLKPTAGAILFRSPSRGEEEAIDLACVSRREWRELRREIQIVFQDAEAALNPRRTVGASVADPLLIHQVISRRGAETRVAELLAMVGLAPDLARRFPAALSAGQRQRVGIARALALGPRLLVCDEPVSSLDSTVQAEILALLSSLRAERGLTLLLIAHDLLVLRDMTERVAVMHGGRLVEHAPTAELFSKPRHPYTERLLFAIPRADKRTAGAADPVDPARAASETAPLAYGDGCRYRRACRLAQPGCAGEDPRGRELAPDHVVACRRAAELTLASPVR